MSEYREQRTFVSILDSARVLNTLSQEYEDNLQHWKETGEIKGRHESTLIAQASIICSYSALDGYLMFIFDKLEKMAEIFISDIPYRIEDIEELIRRMKDVCSGEDEDIKKLLDLWINKGLSPFDKNNKKISVEENYKRISKIIGIGEKDRQRHIDFIKKLTNTRHYLVHPKVVKNEKIKYEYTFKEANKFFNEVRSIIKSVTKHSGLHRFECFIVERRSGVRKKRL